MTKAIDDVIEERRHQVEDEGFDAEHDDAEDTRELAKAARAYVDQYIGRSWLCGGKMADSFGTTIAEYRDDEAPDDWPWEEIWWKPKSPRHDLVRAAALIIAEIERLDRASA